MSCSPAQLEANRRNALRSTGPRTPEGKEAARGNALKHGMTGGGVVIPGEDQAEVAARVEAFQDQLAPDGAPVARSLAAHAALLMVRSERCIRHETAVTADRVRHAEAAFDQFRLAQADGLFADPARNRRQLLAMPEGVDLLLEALAELRLCASPGPTFGWSMDHARRFDACSGHRSGLESRCVALTRGLASQDEPLLAELAGLIDAEVDFLQAHRAGLDTSAIEQSRAEAGQRALIGTDAESLLARKYEAATQRALFRTLKEIREHQKAPTRAQPSAAEITATLIAHAQNLDGIDDDLDDMEADLASFMPPRRPPFPPLDPTAAGLDRPMNRPFADGRPGKNRPRLPR